MCFLTLSGLECSRHNDVYFAAHVAIAVIDFLISATHNRLVRGCRLFAIMQTESPEKEILVVAEFQVFMNFARLLR